MDPYDLADDLDAWATDTPELRDVDNVDPENVELPDDTTELQDFANRLLRKSARLGRDRQQVLDVARAELQRIAQWAEDRSHGIERQQENVEQLLDRLMRAYKAATNGKTLTLPNGVLRLRPSKERLIVEDEKAFVEWARLSKHDDLLRVKYEPDRTKIKDGTKEPHAPDDPPVRFARELSEEPLPGLQRWKLYDTATGEALLGVVVERDEEPTFSLSTERGASDD